MYIVSPGKYTRRAVKNPHTCIREERRTESIVKEKITKINRSLFELEVGIVIFGVICEVVLLFFDNRGYHSLALWIGIITAMACAADMWWALDRGLDLGQQAATKKISIHYMIRYLGIALILVLVSLTKFLNPLICFLGIMGLKVSAYIHKLSKKISTLFYGEEILPELIEIPEDEK